MTEPTTTPQPSLSRSNYLDVIDTFTDAWASLKAAGIVKKGEDGHLTFHDPGTAQDITEAQAIEQVLVNHGLTVPEKVDKVIKAAGAFAPLLEGLLK